MTDLALTPERILDAAEDVLRRYGPAKTTVVDVARFLEVSHGSIYRHFPSKAALRDAVAARWLHRVSQPLAAIAAESDIQPGAVTERLRRWLESLVMLKRQKVLDDPELFATYHTIAEEARAVVQSHVDELVHQLCQIVASGIANGEFKVAEAEPAAKAIFNATVRFHHPAHASEWNDPNIDAEFAQIWQLLMTGLVAGSGAGD